MSSWTFDVSEAALVSDPIGTPVPKEDRSADLLHQLHVHIVQLHPEDIVVIESRRPLGAGRREVLRDALNRHLPDIRTLVLDEDLTLRAVLRKAEAAQAAEESPHREDNA